MAKEGARGRMSGRVLVAPAGSERPPHTHVVLHLQPRAGEVANEMWFVDPRTFGEVVVFDPARLDVEMPDLAKLGVDPLVDEFTPKILRERFARKRGNLKATLLDQHVLAGIGNIYADEALWRAKLHYDQPANSLSLPKTKELLGHVREILAAAVLVGGTSFDEQYKNVNGQSGYFEVSLNAYGMTGRPCPRCGRAIVRENWMNRGSHFCPKCQKRPVA